MPQRAGNGPFSKLQVPIERRSSEPDVPLRSQPSGEAFTPRSSSGRRSATDAPSPAVTATRWARHWTVEEVLRQTLAWVKRGGTRASDLLVAYQRAEAKRKGPRARLAMDQRGIDRRIEWSADMHPLPEPLHYRWHQVRLMLRDLESA
jgi:hypothetical protein